MREPPESRGKPLWIPPPQVRTETLLSHPPPPATGPVENAVETCVQEGNDNPVIRAMGRALFGGFDPDASNGLLQVDVVAVHLHPGLSLDLLRKLGGGHAAEQSALLAHPGPHLD